MTSKILSEAAARAGVSDEQAIALVRELRAFTHGMAEAGDVSFPPFAWPPEFEEDIAESFPGWDGLTRGEYNGTRAAVIWRAVCGYLLDDDQGYGWEVEVWPHPITTRQSD